MEAILSYRGEDFISPEAASEKIFEPIIDSIITTVRQSPHFYITTSELVRVSALGGF